MTSPRWAGRRWSLLMVMAVVIGILALTTPGRTLSPRDGLGVLVWIVWLGCAAAVLALGLLHRREDLGATRRRWMARAGHGLVRIGRGPDIEDRYTVRRGDSLWSVAELQLGSGGRSREIVDLNPELLGGRPGVLPPGLVLRLPRPLPADGGPDGAEPHDEPAPACPFDVHIVGPGETLTGIAERQLGHPARSREIVEASRDILQPGGERLRARGVILPGWKLAIPRPTVDPQEASPAPDQEVAPHDGTLSAP